jgi:hypothetical protein
VAGAPCREAVRWRSRLPWWSWPQAVAIPGRRQGRLAVAWTARAGPTRSPPGRSRALLPSRGRNPNRGRTCACEPARAGRTRSRRRGHAAPRRDLRCERVWSERRPRARPCGGMPGRAGRRAAPRRRSSARSLRRRTRPAEPSRRWRSAGGSEPRPRERLRWPLRGWGARRRRREDSAPRGPRRHRRSRTGERARGRRESRTRSAGDACPGSGAQSSASHPWLDRRHVRTNHRHQRLPVA